MQRSEEFDEDEPAANEVVDDELEPSSGEFKGYTAEPVLDLPCLVNCLGSCTTNAEALP